MAQDIVNKNQNISYTNLDFSSIYTEILELINARQSLDYAIQATMSNSKLMRLTYKRQDMYEIFLSQITSKIYNYEYFW